MNIAHLEEAIRARRLDAVEAADETLADAILNHEALAKRIIRPGSRVEEHAGLVTFFQQVAAQQKGGA
jgi:hypothetical protein